MRITRRWIVPAALTCVAVGTTTVALADASSKLPSRPVRAQTAAASAEIGSTTLGKDLKVTLRAHRTGRYEAWVYVAAFRYTNGGWRPAWHERVPGPWFYAPLTGKNGVCSLKVGNKPQARPTIDVSLLVTPSIGCSATHHFTVR